LGAILRTVEAAGADGVVTTRDSTDIFSVKALRAGLGANLRLPVWSGASLAEVTGWALGNSLVVTAVDAEDGTNYTSLDWKKSRMLVFGSEAHGLSIEELASAEERVMIPMKNDVESLNLSVSCGVILFEALRQREA
jgi:TrmH family RNA methyltransferase